MSRARPILLPVWLCLVVAATALAVGRGSSAASPTAATNGEGGASSGTMLVAAPFDSTDCAVESSLPSEPSPESTAKSRPLCRRLILLEPPVFRRTFAVLSAQCVSASNWVASYLPASEFCTILGRFRI
jgi:hypothetical protein